MAENNMYDWFRDIWIPLIGAVAIPVFIWFMTWYNGASRAEKQKELRHLRDSLNLLISITYSNLDKFLALADRFVKIIEIENRKVGCITPNELEFIFSTLIAENYFETINIEQYAPCIAYKKDFVMDLVTLKNVLQLAHAKIIVRNERIQKAGPIDELSKDIPAALNIIHQDFQENTEFLQEINNIIIKCRDLIFAIQKLESMIKGLKLIIPQFSDDFIQLLTAIEKEFIEYRKNEEKINAR